MKNTLSTPNQGRKLKNEFLAKRIEVLKFDFRKVAKLAKVEDDDVIINEFRRFFVLKAINRGKAFLKIWIYNVVIKIIAITNNQTPTRDSYSHLNLWITFGSNFSSFPKV